MSDEKKRKTPKKQEEKELESRIMKVTMPKEEFAKYDRGETHSKKGIRGDKGRVSSLPDISPISEGDMPTKTVVQTRTKTVVRTRIVEKEPSKTSLGKRIKDELENVLLDTLISTIRDPRVQKAVIDKAKQIWKEYIKPAFAQDSEVDQVIKAAKAKETDVQQKNESSYQIETINENNERIVVSGEEAKILIDALRLEAQKLSGMIFLLSNISIKDEKTNEDHILEEAVIKQLVSDEAQKTMRQLVSHKELLDENTITRFSDFLNGYIQTDTKKIPIPIITESAL